MPDVMPAKLAAEMGALSGSKEDCQDTIAKLKAQFNPANMEIIVRKS
jgi:hypothetical protein